jgi:hypothetical protein
MMRSDHVFADERSSLRKKGYQPVLLFKLANSIVWMKFSSKKEMVYAKIAT